MTVVVGTAGHIDHGKTALLRALTGTDADRLPEERRRGMTIDVGYAHLALPDGDELDFVDVPGHDRLVGNMLVGAGEIDAVLLVVAADDGPRAQTIEHLALLDALGIRDGVAAITKIDLVDRARVDEGRGAVERLLAGTTLAGSPIVAVSSVDGRGLDALGAALLELRDRALRGRPAAADVSPAWSRLAIDRVFAVKGRGAVVTGTLRGRPLSRAAVLRLVPGGHPVRARELQVHGHAVERAGPGRTAINVAGIDASELHRGLVLTDDPEVRATDRLLVRLRAALPDRTRVRVHLGTAAVDAAIGRAGRDAVDLGDLGVAAIVRIARPTAAAAGDRFVLRRSTGADRIVGGVVLDAEPARGVSRRRQNTERVGRLAVAVDAADRAAVRDARLDLHGAMVDSTLGAGGAALADDVAAALAADVLAALAVDPSGDAARPGLAAMRVLVAGRLRRLVSVGRDEAAVAAGALLDRVVADGRIVREGDALRLPGTDLRTPAGADVELSRAMERLERALSVAAPPPLADAARAAGCTSAGVRELERTGRIAVLDDDLAYAAATYRAIEAQALTLARGTPLTPAALRDATGTSRRYVMAILADLDRREILRRTEVGHVPGRRAATVVASTASAGAGRT